MYLVFVTVPVPAHPSQAVRQGQRNEKLPSEKKKAERERLEDIRKENE